MYLVELASRGLAPAFLIVLVFISVACDPRAENTFVKTPDEGVTTEDVASNPDAHIGQRVTVVAPVKGTFGEQAFVLHAEGLADDLLAVGADPYPNERNESIHQQLMDAKGVRVTGVVRRFDRPAIERETGLKLDDQRLDAYEQKPVIIVESLQAVD